MKVDFLGVAQYRTPLTKELWLILFCEIKKIFLKQMKYHSDI